MKADYKNWVPKERLRSMAVNTCVLGGLSILTKKRGNTDNEKMVGCISRIMRGGSVVLAAATAWMYMLHRAFDYNGKRKMSKQIIDGLASYVRVPEEGSVLDVGCGSGALSIAVARRNPKAKIYGVDRWGREYSSFSKRLCEKNALAEGVRNVFFMKGDATRLNFPDEKFDAVTSNYVYHNITGKDRQELLMETLRVLKKGGKFAVHDIFSKAKYGDMEAFLDRLKKEGYREARLIDTTDGLFMNRWESIWMGLSGSAILYGTK